MTQQSEVVPRADELSPEAIRQQLELLVEDKVFRSSKRSIQFLRYVVEQTLNGQAEGIKERTIGVEVFGRDLSYETSSDHVVRTAAIDLRKRLSLYYSDASHRSELVMSITPGSYIPHFSLPPAETGDRTESSEGGRNSLQRINIEHPVVFEQPAPVVAVRPFLPSRRFALMVVTATIAVLLLGFSAYKWSVTHNLEYRFWRPLLDSPRTVLLAVGDIPSGPPSVEVKEQGQDIPIIQRGSATNVPFADTVTIARVLSVLQSHGKRVIIRPEVISSFSDLEEGPVVLIGAFNNEWSLRLTHQLRFSLSLDPDRHLIYIRDAQKPDDRSWSQVTGSTIEEQQIARGGPVRHDYALISRVRNPQTGQFVVIIGGLYAYGTQAAGEFITTPEMLESIGKTLAHTDQNSDLQFVLETDITDDTPGVPKVLSVSTK